MSNSTEGKDLELTAAELEAVGKLTDAELEAVVGGGLLSKMKAAMHDSHSAYSQLTPDQRAKLKAAVDGKLRK